MPKRFSKWSLVSFDPNCLGTLFDLEENTTLKKKTRHQNCWSEFQVVFSSRSKRVFKQLGSKTISKIFWAFWAECGFSEDDFHDFAKEFDFSRNFSKKDKNEDFLSSSQKKHKTKSALLVLKKKNKKNEGCRLEKRTTKTPKIFKKRTLF